MDKNVAVMGGGTFNYVRSHLSLAVPAFGETARQIFNTLRNYPYPDATIDYMLPTLYLTKMANPRDSNLITNQDVEETVDRMLEDGWNGIFFNVAMCDYNGKIGNVESGKYAERLQSRRDTPSIQLTPAAKVLKKIRETHKEIYTVGFKTTTGATGQEQYEAGLKLLKESSINLVLANDTVTRRNYIIVPEEAWYYGGTDRITAITELVDIFVKRQGLKYTRSIIAPGPSIPWNGPDIPPSLKTIVDHCISKGAYKPFLGKTSGHFAFKLNDTTFVTSKRKTNYNDLNNVGMVKVNTVDKDTVIAYGDKPSVGGQSQRIVFQDHKDMDCIVHFHCPPRVMSGSLPQADQRSYECGSHQCGENTSKHLQEVAEGIKAVFLTNHGPNIVFNRNIDPAKVINYIESTYDLSAKTGGTFTSHQTTTSPLTENLSRLAV